MEPLEWKRFLAVPDKNWNMEEIISCLTDKPIKRFDLPISVIENDTKANLTLFDPDTEYVFEKDTTFYQNRKTQHS